MSLATVIRTWRIGVTGPAGTGVMDVPSLSEETAKRRAFWTAASLRWGDVDELEVTSCEEIYSCCVHCACPSPEGHPAPCTGCRQPLITTDDQRVARAMAAEA